MEKNQWKLHLWIVLTYLFEKMSTYHNNPEKSSTEKKLCIKLPVIHCLQIAHLMQQKISLIITEAKTVWKGFVKT